MMAPSAPALSDPSATHPLANGHPVQAADGDHPIPAAAAGDTPDPAAHGDGDECVPGGATVGLGQFRRAEVGDADLDPVHAPAGADGDAQAVAVPDIDDGSGEGRAGAEIGGHGAPIGDAGAGVGAGRASEDQEACGQDDGAHDHGADLTRKAGAAQ